MRRVEKRTVYAALGLVVLLVAGIGMVLLWGSQRSATTMHDRVQSIAAQLRCPVCQGESVADSPSGLAQSMRTLIRRELQRGKNSDQIKSYFVQRYGQWILLAPPASGLGAVVWFGPPLALLLGLIGVGVLAFSWSRRRPAPSMLRMDRSQDPEDAALELDRLDQMPDERSISAEEYRLRRDALERKGAGVSGPKDASAGKRSGTRIWPHVAALTAAALIIAGTISLAVQPRDSGPLNGSIPSSNPTPGRQTAGPSPVVKAANYAVAHPRNPAAWVRLGSVMLTHREYGGARRAFARAIHLDRQNEGARLGAAFLDIGRSRYRDALAQLTIVKRVDPSSARLWMLEGLANARLPGGHGRAIAAWKRFLALKPHSSLAPAVRGWISRLRQGAEVP